MTSDRKRKSGFYWVRFEGQPLVAEWSVKDQVWRVPGAEETFSDREVCELLSGLIPTPKELVKP